MPSIEYEKKKKTNRLGGRVQFAVLLDELLAGDGARGRVGASHNGAVSNGKRVPGTRRRNI